MRKPYLAFIVFLLLFSGVAHAGNVTLNATAEATFSFLSADPGIEANVDGFFSGGSAPTVGSASSAFNGSPAFALRPLSIGEVLTTFSFTTADAFDGNAESLLITANDFEFSNTSSIEQNFSYSLSYSQEAEVIGSSPLFGLATTTVSFDDDGLTSFSNSLGRSPSNPGVSELSDSIVIDRSIAPGETLTFNLTLDSGALAAAAVPEPCSLSVLGLLGIGMFCGRRRRVC